MPHVKIHICSRKVRVLMWKAEGECILHKAVLRATAKPSSTGASAIHRHIDPIQMLTVISEKQ